MAHLFLKTVHSEFEGELTTTEKYVLYAQRWTMYKYPRGIPKFQVIHRDKFVEMAFFSAFQAWEEFLEETFTLYLLGKKPPKGKRLRSLIPVQTRKQARHMLLHGRQYIDWSPLYKILDHNKSSFDDHTNTCFRSLKGIEKQLNEISDIRNAIAHRSENSWETFKTIVRNRLRGAYPANMSVGRFLITMIPGSSPPETFLDDYLNHLRFGASLIVPP